MFSYRLPPINGENDGRLTRTKDTFEKQLEVLHCEIFAMKKELTAETAKRKKSKNNFRRSIAARPEGLQQLPKLRDVEVRGPRTGEEERRHCSGER